MWLLFCFALVSSSSEELWDSFQDVWPERRRRGGPGRVWTGSADVSSTSYVQHMCTHLHKIISYHIKTDRSLKELAHAFVLIFNIQTSFLLYYSNAHWQAIKVGSHSDVCQSDIFLKGEWSLLCSAVCDNSICSSGYLIQLHMYSFYYCIRYLNFRDLIEFCALKVNGYF